MFLLETAVWSQSRASESSNTQKYLEMDLPINWVNVDQWWIDASILYQLQSCLFSDSFASSDQYLATQKAMFLLTARLIPNVPRAQILFNPHHSVVDAQSFLAKINIK
jgi:hypothetical protein